MDRNLQSTLKLGKVGFEANLVVVSALDAKCSEHPIAIRVRLHSAQRLRGERGHNHGIDEGTVPGGCHDSPRRARPKLADCPGCAGWQRRRRRWGPESPSPFSTHGPARVEPGQRRWCGVSVRWRETNACASALGARGAQRAMYDRAARRRPRVGVHSHLLQLAPVLQHRAQPHPAPHRATRSVPVPCRAPKAAESSFGKKGWSAARCKASLSEAEGPPKRGSSLFSGMARWRVEYRAL